MLAVLVAVSERCKKWVQKIYSKVAKWASHLIVLSITLLNFRFPLMVRSSGLVDVQGMAPRSTSGFGCLVHLEATVDEAESLRGTYPVRNTALRNLNQFLDTST